MKFRYQLTAQIGVLDAVTRQPLIPHEHFVALYDSPIELNFLNPLHQAVVKRVVKITFETSLLEEDRLMGLGMQETVTDVSHLTHEYLKQIRKREDEL